MATAGSWLTGWLTSYKVPAAELGKSMGSFYDSTLATATASFDITSIPTWGSHLLIEATLRGDTASPSVSVYGRLNNDSGASYDHIYTTNSSGTSMAAGETFGAAQIAAVTCPAASSGTAFFGGSDISIRNFRGTTAHKEVLWNANMKVGLSTGNLSRYSAAGFWRSTAAITRVTILPSTGNFAAGSRVTAYVLGP